MLKWNGGFGRVWVKYAWYVWNMVWFGAWYGVWYSMKRYYMVMVFYALISKAWVYKGKDML